MRDLAQTIGGSRQNSKKRILRIVVIAVLVVSVVFVVNNFFFGKNSVGGSAVGLRDAPFGLKPVGVSAQETTVKGGVDLTTQSATFKDVKGDGGSASATRSFGGGTYILNVDASLPDPKNTYYQVWLVGGGEVVPVDFMSGSKTSWSLTLRDTDKFSKYKGIWITLERTKDSKPEEHILEGTF